MKHLSQISVTGQAGLAAQGKVRPVQDFYGHVRFDRGVRVIQEKATNAHF